jgi:Flp pilus assembly protein CpaB
VIAQRVLIAVALAGGSVAGVLYYIGAQRVPVIVAARDVDAARPLTGADLASVDFLPDAIPAGALSELGLAIGKIPRAPLWKGQVLLSAALGDEAAAFHSGIVVPAGAHAVALPVSPAQALGGAIVPGAAVDVLAVPIPGRAPPGRVSELLARAALVLDVRTETGTAYTTATRGGTALSSDRIGSVVIAIDRTDEIRVADRIATSTFVLVLARADR